MAANLKNQALLVRKEWTRVKDETKEIRETLAAGIEALMEKLKKFEEAWKGDWFSNSNRFDMEREGKSLLTCFFDETYIQNEIQEESGFKIDYQSKLVAISERFHKLRDFILAELSFIKGKEEYMGEETVLLDEIKGFKWGMKPREYAKSKAPIIHLTSNPLEFSNFQTPPHIVIADRQIHAWSLLMAYDQFEALSNRLLRLIELNTDDYQITSSAVASKSGLFSIVEKFHLVSKQLRNRHENRGSIVLSDEYDVQDLFHALLLIFFEDIRSEDYVPSFAGRNSRVDFLLKKEKIVIEIKMTRNGLGEKQVGDELLRDIARYKSHPDCNTLICFVYDPESHIANPRGLENDLAKFSTEEMEVIIFVRP
jgi:REase_DpnII-MboI